MSLQRQQPDVETLSEFFANCIDESTVDPELFRAAQSIEPLIAQFIDDCLDDVMRHAPMKVGFTSNFQQQIASLSLANRIKEKDPTITIVLAVYWRSGRHKLGWK